MSSSKSRKNKKSHSKKEKQLIKLINNSDSESECSEHELSHYLNDRVKLMKEVLKIIKPKKIRSMAPDCVKKFDNEEINSMLLEELLGISNKRLKYIFNGQTLEEDSSSTDPEDEQQQKPIDIISLDDISDDDFIDLDSDATSEKKGKKKHTKTKIKEEPKKKKIKKEKYDKTAKEKASKKHKEAENDKTGQENLMSVLELLELQARARAIRSQLALENSKKAQEKEQTNLKVEESDHDDAVIIESPKNIEIVITSSESETDEPKKNNSHCTITQNVAEDNIETRKEHEENSNQSVIESTDKNSNENNTLENQMGELEGEINNKEKDRSISEDKNIESSNQPNLIIEQNKSESRSRNREARTEKEEIGSTEQHHEQVKGDENVSEKEEKAQTIIKLSNTEEDTSIRDSISEDILIIDSESESDITLDRSVRRKCKKSKKSRTERSHYSDLEIDKKSKTKSRREGCKHKTSKAEKELKIKSEAIEAEQTKVKSIKMPISGKNSNQDEGEGIVINMDPSEIDCIISD